MNFKQALNKVKAFAFDVDGVLSQSVIHTGAGGELLRTMNTKDGYALHLASKLGYPIAIISGAHSEDIRAHYEFLGVSDVYLKAHTKTTEFADFLNRHSLQAEEVLYMGDDIPDYEVMQICGVPTCPADAVPEIKTVAAYVSDMKSGEGCVRDVIQQTLAVQDKWMNGKEAFSW